MSSHLLGEVKPEPGSYRAALDVLGARAQDVVFLDDAQANVDGATSAGLRAFRVDGVAGAMGVLAANGWLPGSPA